MREFLSKKLDQKEVPSEARERLLNAANLYLLAKEFGDLFGNKVPQVSKEIGKTLSEQALKSKTKKDENT